MPILESLSPATLPHGVVAGRRFSSLEAYKNTAGYGATLLVALAAMTATLQLWRVDWRVPFDYKNDNLMGQMFIQNILESGWALDGPRLGAPGRQNLRDFPLPDVLHIGTIKLLGYFFHDSGLILNLFYLLCFPLTALTSYFVLRRFRLGRIAALTAAVLYACLPYHYARMGGHLFLAAYYLLPLMVWLLVRVYLGRYPLRHTDAGDGKPGRRFVSADAAGAALICVLTGLAGIYYAFFSCFLLLAVGVKSACRERCWTPLIVSALLVLLVSIVVGLTLVPSLLYQSRYGVNAGAAVRMPGEADLYGLSISEMLAPIEGHRLGAFRWLRARVLAPPRRLTGEVQFVPLGLTASLGFFYLLGRFLLRRRNNVERTDDALAYLALVAVLLGTVGGLGSCFNLYVTPMIRCYNRLSVFIGFFALAGWFLLLQQLIARYDRSVGMRVVHYVGLFALLIVGLLDQTSPHFTAAYAESKREYQSDADFGRRMEAMLPPRSMVYQMPYVVFPEAARLMGKQGDYELLRPYFHTRTLRFSYGAMKNRAASDWLGHMAEKPTPEALQALALAGFRGVYLDRAGFTDSGTAVEAELAHLLNAVPLVSLNGRQVFFDMTSYVSALNSRYTDAEWDAKTNIASHPLELEWGGAYSEEKPPAGGTLRWCWAKPQLNIRNPLNRSRRVLLKMTLSTWQDEPVRLVLGGDLCRREFTLTEIPQPLRIELIVPPGEHLLSFACAGRRIGSPDDPRELVFRVEDFKYYLEGE